jgi:AraC-like DNA-binding protein
MTGPCPYALALSRVPRQKWATRAELLDRVELTRKLIEQAPGQNLTITSLSRLAGLSESHFIRLFGDTYGLSPRKMLSNRRMELSKQLLSQGMDLNKVALAIGYSSIPTFCRRFKNAFGLTPTEYRHSRVSEPGTI